MKSTLTQMNEGRWSVQSSDWRGYYFSEKCLILDDRVKKTIGFLDDLPAGVLLDVGCSDGVLTKAAVEKTGAQFSVGIDITQLNEAKKNNVAAVYYDLNSKLWFPFADDSFDAVVCGGTLEHLLDTDHTLKQIKRVLKKGGVLVLSVPRIDSLLSIILLALGFQPPSIECSLIKRHGTINSESQVSGHVSHFTKKALLGMLSDHGFRVSGYKDSGIYSSWLLAQKASGKKPFLSRIILKLFDLIPVKKDVCVVKAYKT